MQGILISFQYFTNYMIYNIDLRPTLFPLFSSGWKYSSKSSRLSVSERSSVSCSSRLAANATAMRASARTTSSVLVAILLGISKLIRNIVVTNISRSLKQYLNSAGCKLGNNTCYFKFEISLTLLKFQLTIKLPRRRCQCVLHERNRAPGSVTQSDVPREGCQCTRALFRTLL